MTDDELDGDLRAMLARRDPGPVPAALTVAIREQIVADRRPSRFPALRAWAGGAAAVGAIATVIVLAIVIGRPSDGGPGSSVAPDAQPPYAIQAGDGVVIGEHVPVFQALAALVVFAALLLVTLRTRGKSMGIASALGCLGIALIALTIGKSDALVFRDGGYGVTPGRSAPDAAPGLYVAVTGDQPFHLVVTITNGSQLPLELQGLVEPAVLRFGTDETSATLPRFVAIAALPGVDMDLSLAQPFRPVTIPPGAQLNVDVLGMAGTCAIPAAGPDGEGGIVMEHVGLVYEQLTIVHTQDFLLPEPVHITTPANGCS